MPKVQGRMTVRRRPSDGTPGKDGISVQVSPGTLTFKKGVPSSADVYVDLYVGDRRIGYDGGKGFLCSSLGSVVSMADGLTWSFKITDDGRFFYRLGYTGKQETSIVIPFTVTYGDTVINRQITVNTVKNGEQGIPGIQGCIYRVTEWQEGKEYRNDSELATAGLRYIDVVLIPNPALASKAEAYMCKETHVQSSSDNAPGTAGGSKCWTELNNFAPIFTPFLLADGAVITLLQSNQVTVMKEDGSTVNVALGGGKYPLWIGNPDPTQSNFYVDDLGRAHMTEAEIIGKIIAGIANGQRVELQPDNKAMKIYDSSGDEVCSFEGNSYTDLSKLFDSKSGQFIIKSRTETEYGFSAGTTLGRGTDAVIGNGKEIQEISRDLIISETLHIDVPAEISVSGHLGTSYTVSPDYGAVSPVDIGASSGVKSFKPVQVKTASASIALYVDTYSDAGLTTKVASAQVIALSARSGTRALSGVRVRTSTGGYHVLRLAIRASATGSGMSASLSWGMTASGRADITAGYVTDFYVSRYFANGFCLGQSSENYIWAYKAANNSMRFIMETGGYGFEVRETGIRHRHHGGSWCNLPLFVLKGRCQYNGNAYTWYNFSSFDNRVPTFTRMGKGRIRINLPSEWTGLGLSLTNSLVNVVGFGAIDGGDAPIKATLVAVTGTYIDIYLSDDASENDGGFVINIFII